ncbi:MAG: uncharacterized protein JWN14_3719 [Chthonomonadales bacterium]|nr:uncharacterized protein [Chthonomonadales bacterium]
MLVWKQLQDGLKGITRMNRCSRRLATILLLTILSLVPGVSQSKPGSHRPARGVHVRSHRAPIRLPLPRISVYLYQPEEIGSPREIAATAKRIGFDAVFVKGLDGTQAFRSPVEIRDLVRALHKAKIQAFVWGYLYANHPREEAQRIIALLHEPHVSGYVFDAEDDVEEQGKWENVALVLHLVKQHRDTCPACKKKLLGADVHAFPSRHPDLPYRTLVEAVDFISPMMYWGEMQRKVGNTVQHTSEEWVRWEKQNHLSVPILPLGQCYCEKGLDPKPGELLRFARLTRRYKCLSWWEFGSMLHTGMEPEMKSVIAMIKGKPSRTQRLPKRYGYRRTNGKRV